MSKKRHWDPSTIDTRLVEIYEDLTNESEVMRLKAAASLLSKFSPEKSPTKDQILGVLTRLIRGLCSSRKAARLGFSIALTEFLVQTHGRPEKDVQPQLDTEEAIETLKKETIAQGDASGNVLLAFFSTWILIGLQEAKNHDFGRLFGAEAVIKSGVLFRPNASIKLWTQILDLILELGKKRTWLRTECGWVLYKVIEILGRHNDYVQLLVDKIFEHGLAKTPEGVAIWLRAQSMAPSVRFPEGLWHANNPLHRKELKNLANVLKQGPSTKLGQAIEAEIVNQKANLSPDLHFAWEVVISQVLNAQHSAASKLQKKTKIPSFHEFWNEAVDDGLFSTSSTDQRKYWGLMLFQRLLRNVPTNLLPTIFSDRLMRCLINQLASQERYLHTAAQKALNSICARVEQEPSATIIIIKAMSRSPDGPINFDQISRTKVVEKLLAHVQDYSLVELSSLFSQLITKASEQDEKTAATSKRMAADQLVSVMRSKLISASTKGSNSSETNVFIDQAFALLAKHAYFVHRQQFPASVPTLEEPTAKLSREMFKSRISSSLSIVLAKCAEPAPVSYNLIAYIRSLEKEDNDLNLPYNSDDAVKKTIEKAWSTLKKIHSRSMSAQGSRKRLQSAFDLLYAFTLLQVYNGEAEAVGILDELKDSYDGLLKHKQESDQGSSDTLIEILLSFASKPSLLFRRLAQEVFSACTSDVSSRGLKSMIKVLETKESLAGQEEIFDQEDDESQDVSDDYAPLNPSTTSDFSMTEAGPNNEDGNSAENSSVESDDDSGNGPDEELAAFDAKLALALGTRPATDDLAADDSEGSSDSDMNDEQMEALDEHLEKVFQERKKLTSKKNQNKDAKEAIANFKCRVLELLDIYIKQQHRNSLALDILIPLLDVIRSTRSPLVSTRCCDLVRSYSKLCKPNNVPVTADSNIPITLLREVHVRAGKEGSNAYGAACSHASLLLVKILAAQDRENLRLVESVYGETHQAFILDSKSMVKPSFFTDWLNWSVSARRA